MIRNKNVKLKPIIKRLQLLCWIYFILCKPFFN